jgi:hypothetical protein
MGEKELSPLLDPITTKDTVTENWMVAHSTTSNFNVDMFGKIGSMRKESDGRILDVFVKAFNENPLTAMRLLFWTRDIRGGAGERQIFKTILLYLANQHTDVLGKNLHLITEYGRWDDLLVLFGTKLEDQALALIGEALKEGNGLCAKWMPRQGKKGTTRNELSNKIRKYLKLSPKKYRKLLVEASNTVEQLMCSGGWNAIDFSKLPSKAMSDYMKAFSKRTPEAWVAYLESVKKGEAKINAGAIFPYDVTKNLRFGSQDGADVQWNALPDHMEGSNERVMPLVDVSGSMGTSAGGNPNVSCMDVAVSLGLYISERNVGPYKDAFITFSSNPRLQILKGSLSDRFQQLRTSDWGMSTDIQKALTLILDKAKASKVAQDDMPTMLMILSDMQFDQCTGASYWGDSSSEWNKTALEMTKALYAKAGYEMPKVVFWNLAGRNDNTPVKSNDSGTALVSGFSPALLLSLLSGKDISPYSMMMDVVNSERYETITI